MSCSITLALCLAAAGIVSLAAAQSTQPMLFVANSHSSNISRYHVQGEGDDLLSPDSPVSPGQESLTLTALTPDGSFLFVTGDSPSAPPGGAELRGLRVAPDGSVALEPTLTTTLPSAPAAMAVATRDGRTFLYLFPIVTIVYAYELVDSAAGPTLQPVPGQPFTSPGAMYFGDAAATPDGRHLYAVKAFVAGLTGFTIADDGSLTLLDMPALAALDHIRAVSISPDNQHLYAAIHSDVPGSQTAHVRAYDIGADGLLTELPGSPFVSSPVVPDRVSDMAITPAGDRLIALNFISHTVTVMTRHADGTLASTFQSDAFINDFAAIQATDGHALVLVQPGGVIPMPILADGTLAAPPTPPVPAGANPVSMALWLSADGNFAAGDLNHDGVVDGVDLALLLGAWGRCITGPSCPADLSGDGIVNGIDLALLLGQWG